MTALGSSKARHRSLEKPLTASASEMNLSEIGFKHP